MWCCNRLFKVLRFISIILITAIVLQNSKTTYFKLQEGLLCFMDLLSNNDGLLLHKDPRSLASSVWCVKRLDGSTMCKFKNIYFFPQFKDHLVLLLNEHSIISGIESAAALQDINLSTVKNHTNCNLKLIILKSEEFILKQNLRLIGLNTVIMKRFKPDNIMHVIHDDLLPLFITFQELCYGNVEQCLSTHQLLFFDYQDEGPYFEWYSLFSNQNFMLLKYINIGLVFKNAIIGLSQVSVWFDYGFENVQRPLNNAFFNGLYLDKFSTFIKQKFGIKTTVKPLTVIFLNREINRKILNGNMIKKYIEEMFQSDYKKNVNVLSMDLSVNSSKSVISALHQSKFLIGMHGSAMILAIFMSEGSNIIELFPFGIQPEFVSPIKALCSLSNVHYNYNTWINTNENNSISHPEYPPLNGGILHLPTQEQEKVINTKLVPPVKCCHNPLYLFRMFQDTLVDKSIYPVINKMFRYTTANANREDYRKRIKVYVHNRWYYPSSVFNLTCECISSELKLNWTYPINTLSNIKFSIYVSNGLSLITNLTYFSLPMIECDLKNVQKYNIKSPLLVWVKSIEGSQESLDTYKQCN